MRWEINFTERVFTANEAPKEVENSFCIIEMATKHLYHQAKPVFLFVKAAAEQGGAKHLYVAYYVISGVCSSTTGVAEPVYFAQRLLKYTKTQMPAEKTDANSGQGAQLEKYAER